MKDGISFEDEYLRHKNGSTTWFQSGAEAKTFCYTRYSFALRVCRLGLETFAYFRKILGFTPQLEFIKENLWLANSLLAYFHIRAEQGAGKHPADEDKARKKLENVLSDRLGLELGILYEKDTKNESFTQRQL